VLSSPPPAPAGAPGVVALKTDAWDGAVWPNLANDDPPTNTRGQGFITTLDRVFYFQDGTTIRRIQCWGDPDPGHANWPDETAAAMPSTDPLDLKDLNPFSGATLQEECSPAELFARNVQSFELRYFDASGAEVVGANTGLLKASIRRISYRVVLQKNDARGRSVEESIESSVAIRNAGANS
jgi:hypothetical protein